MQGMLQEIRADKAKRSELELLEAENNKLRDKVAYLEDEVNMLKAELAMYKAIEKPKG